jgi:phosphatidylinositol 4-kinase A
VYRLLKEFISWVANTLLSRRIRRNALEKLASLSAKSLTSTSGQSDLAKLCKRCPPTSFKQDGIDSRKSNNHTNTANVRMVSEQ